jgi:hypothetical protein
MNHPILPAAERPFELLVRKMGGEEGAAAVLQELSSQMGVRLQWGLTGVVPDQVLAAVALIRAGMTLDTVSSSLTWQEFEGFCANLLKVHGYSVKTNIVLTKPRRQLDIFAEAQTLALSIDCKHWGKSSSGSVLEQGRGGADREDGRSTRGKESVKTARLARHPHPPGLPGQRGAGSARRAHLRAQGLRGHLCQPVRRRARDRLNLDIDSHPDEVSSAAPEPQNFAAVSDLQQSAAPDNQSFILQNGPRVLGGAVMNQSYEKFVYEEKAFV